MIVKTIFCNIHWKVTTHISHASLNDLKKTITNSGWTDFNIWANHKQQIWPGLKFPSSCWAEQKINKRENLREEWDFSHDFLKLKMQQETNTTTKVLAKKLPLASRLKQSPKTPAPSLSHQNLPLLLYFLISRNVSLSCLSKQCARKTATLYYSSNSCNFSLLLDRGH